MPPLLTVSTVTLKLRRLAVLVLATVLLFVFAILFSLRLALVLVLVLPLVFTLALEECVDLHWVVATCCAALGIKPDAAFEKSHDCLAQRLVAGAILRMT